MRINLPTPVLSLLFILILVKGYTQQITISGPAGSGSFGNVTFLPMAII